MTILDKTESLKKILDNVIDSITQAIIANKINHIDDDDNDDDKDNDNYYTSNGVNFSITDYFFVSNYVARHRPDVPESGIVMAYRSTLPRNIRYHYYYYYYYYYYYLSLL